MEALSETELLTTTFNTLGISTLVKRIVVVLKRKNLQILKLQNSVQLCLLTCLKLGPRKHLTKHARLSKAFHETSNEAEFFTLFSLFYDKPLFCLPSILYNVGTHTQSGIYTSDG